MTPYGITPRQRDIYLAPVPYSDSEQEKLRPFLVLSSSIQNASGLDVIGMAITSRLDSSLPGVIVQPDCLERGQLPRPSKILPVRIFTQNPMRLVKLYGRLKAEPFRTAVEMLLEIIS